MGNSPSRYKETNWEEADGNLTTATETIDKSEPTKSHTVITISPTGLGNDIPLVNQIFVGVSYEVKDSDGKIIYTTQKVPKLEKGFDLVDSDGNTVVRVDSTYSNRTWHIFQVGGEPIFEGQRPDPKPSDKCGEELYRKAGVSFGKGEQHTAFVHMFRGGDKNDDGDGDGGDDVHTVLKVERCSSGMVSTKWHFQTMQATTTSEDENKSESSSSASLSGYWKWEGTPIPLTKEHRMVMDLAKKSDLALHVILAVVSNIERASVKAEYTG